LARTGRPTAEEPGPVLEDDRRVRREPVGAGSHLLETGRVDELGPVGLGNIDP
jgi:hypothetical protein